MFMEDKRISFRNWLDVNCNYGGGANWMYKRKSYWLVPLWFKYKKDTKVINVL